MNLTNQTYTQPDPDLGDRVAVGVAARGELLSLNDATGS